MKNDKNGSDIEVKGQNWWKMKKIIFFGFLEKGYENVEKSENGWKWVRYWWKRSKLMKNEKNNIFCIFSEKYWKNSKKVKNDKNGSDIEKNGQNWWKMKTIIFFGFFQKNMETCRKKWKMMKIGQILMKKVKIDEKWKQ